jgi:DNA-binding CsgD family transcriptional regulator
MPTSARGINWYFSHLQRTRRLLKLPATAHRLAERSMNSWNLDSISQSFASAAVQPDLWIRAMDTIATETGSVGAVLIPLRGTMPNVPSSESVLRSTEAYFRDGWHANDERFRSVEVMTRRGVARDFDFISPDEMRRHPYYQEFLRPVGLQYFAGIKMAAGDDLWCVSIQRSPQQGPFSPNQMRKLALLSGRFSSAGALARALGFSTAKAVMETFELTKSAVALLNRRGEVLLLSQAAEALLDPELQVVEKRLTSRDRNATATLDRALHSLLWSSTASTLLPPVMLPRSRRRPLVAYPIKLSAMSVNVFADYRALLVMVDPEQRPVLSQGLLKSAFGLTAAEARLANRLSAGEALERVADELQISKETVRNQLKSVFQKTGVHRQSDLVALLASFLYRR